MTTKMRTLRDFRNPIGCLILLAAFAAAAGCSTAESPSGSATNMNHVLPSGSSVEGWLVLPSGGTHASTATLDYIDGGGTSGCAQCHGSDLTGGISKVSCFGNSAGCHHGPVTGWVAPPPAAQNHGASAKRAPGSSGFAACQICHGGNFSGGGAKVTCLNNAFCHGAGVLSPHPPQPWRGPTYTHTNTDPSNAPVCAGCHRNSTPGTPGCFNNTLCHAQPGAPHPVGSAWVATSPAAQPHGNDAKATPGVTTGFTYCQVCHGTGTDFAGGSSGVSCYPCHSTTTNSPHASQWRTGDTYVHTTTATGNASVCAFCHLNGTNSPVPPPSPPAPAGTAPGCFNGTLCHAGVAPHPVPFNDPIHYNTTSTTFQGATYPPGCIACHDVSAPSTKAGPVCQTCHVAASPLAAANCTSCHASPPDGGTGAAYANIAGAHGAHLALDNTGSPVSCDTCHNGLGPSLLNLNHYDRAKSRVPPGDVAFLATYNAQSGSSSFSSAGLSCSNVSCHGGQATPNWQAGAINVDTQCTNCHAQGTAQYNSYNSGEHQLHVGGQTLLCTFCHNTTALAVDHFTTLADNSISPAVASATIGGAGTLITTWTPTVGTTSGTCNAACHPGDRTW